MDFRLTVGTGCIMQPNVRFRLSYVPPVPDLQAHAERGASGALMRLTTDLKPWWLYAPKGYGTQAGDPPVVKGSDFGRPDPWSESYESQRVGVDAPRRDGVIAQFCRKVGNGGRKRGCGKFQSKHDRKMASLGILTAPAFRFENGGGNRNVASHDGLLHGRRGSRFATAICPTTWPPMTSSTEADSSKIVGGG